MKPMNERYRRPDWTRRLLAMGDSLGGRVEGARELVPIDPDSLLEAARSALGDLRGDFGDPHWVERFGQLARAIDGSPMHVVGRLLTKQELLRSLRTRLLLNRHFAEVPAIAQEQIRAPIIVTGPARSGTSILFELLWLDPELRGPLAWEALHPVRSPGLEDAHARQAASECEQEIWADIQPEFAAMHELRSDLPVECVTLTSPSFANTHWSMVSQMRDYAPDFDEMYAYHKRILQVLQCDGDPRHAGKTWLLKTPGHIMTIDHVFATYPDAWVVQTHRDPAKTMPSTVSITATVQWMRHDEVDIALLGQIIQQSFTGALNGVSERRQKGELPERFVDVHFQSLLRDPVATIRGAYERMGRPFSREHAAAIERYLAEKPKGKFGVHKYTPEDWGFRAEDLRAQAAPYIEHFGVEPE